MKNFTTDEKTLLWSHVFRRTMMEKPVSLLRGYGLTVQTAAVVLSVTLFLFVLENILGNDFFCPCNPLENVVIFVVFLTVPAFTSAVFTFCLIHLYPGEKKGKLENRPRARNGGLVFPYLTALIWMSICFCDGRYFACGCSNWAGIYSRAENSTFLRWCRPTEEEPSESESLTKTIKFIFQSQCVGFILMGFTALVALITSLRSKRTPMKTMVKEQIGTWIPKNNPSADDVNTSLLKNKVFEF